MRTTASLSTALLLTIGSPWACGALGAPAGGDGRGLSVRLEVPWTTLTVGEQVQYEYILSNAADRAVSVAVPDDGSRENAHFGWPAGGQPFLEPRYPQGVSVDQLTPLDRALVVGKAVWPPRDGMGGNMRAWLELPAGQRIVWNQNRLPASYFGVASISALKGIQAHWLVGPGRWISSAVVPLKVVSVPMSEWRTVFDAKWSSYGYGKDVRLATAYVIPIDGKAFLFLDSYRIAEVTVDDRFEHQIDKDGTNMEITVIGPSGSRKVHHHLRHGITRDTAWPIGPVSLFYPKPEPISPAELEALRKEMAQSPSEAGPPQGASPSSPPTLKSGPQSLGSQHDGTAFLPWFAGGIALLIAFAAAVVIRAKRNKTRS